MPQARFYLIFQDEEEELDATTAELAQIESINKTFYIEEIMLFSNRIYQDYCFPVFDEKEENGKNLGPYGDQNATKQTFTEPYIIRR